MLVWPDFVRPEGGTLVADRPPRNACEEELQRLGWVAEEHYSLDGFRFGLRSTDADFLELARTYLGHLLIDGGKVDDVLFSADCGDARPDGEPPRAISLYRDGVTVFRGGDRKEMLGQMIATARDIAVGQSSEFVRLRGGAVGVDGSAIVLPSESNPHLPALVAFLVASGAGFLGDELINIDPILRRIHGLPIPLLIGSDDLPLVQTLEATSGRPGRQPPGPDDPSLQDAASRMPVSPAEIGGVESDPVPIGWIVFPSFRPGAETTIDPPGDEEVLGELVRSCVNPDVWGERAPVLLRSLVESVPVSRLVVGSIREAADLIRRTAPQIVER